MDRFEVAVETIGMLADDLRRQMYLFIREQGRPVGRDEAAEAVGISRNLAAFHLDKLAAKGLLSAHYVRLSGKRGPGAGRPAKVYEPTTSEVSVAIPARSYDFAGRILLEALQRPAPSHAAVRDTAWEEGVALGRSVRCEKGLRAVDDENLTNVAKEVLFERGYEPYRDEDGALRLRNCPFHVLARQSVELVCGMNHAFIAGFLEGLGNKTMNAELDPRTQQCCVRICHTQAVA